jgi:hypothetical protein
MLRSHIAAHVPGLDPFVADALAEVERARVPLSPEDLAAVANAQPSLYRVLLSAKNLAAWWQWRVQRDVPLWTGPRMGRTFSVPGQDGETRWWFTAGGPNYTLTVHVYPARKSGFLHFGPVRPSRIAFLQKAFEEDLYGEAASARTAAGAVVLAGPAGPALVPGAGAAGEGALAGTHWRTAPAPDGAIAMRLYIESTKRDGVTVNEGDVVRKSSQFQSHAAAVAVAAAGGQARADHGGGAAVAEPVRVGAWRGGVRARPAVAVPCQTPVCRSRQRLTVSAGVRGARRGVLGSARRPPPRRRR